VSGERLVAALYVATHFLKLPTDDSHHGIGFLVVLHEVTYQSIDRRDHLIEVFVPGRVKFPETEKDMPDGVLLHPEQTFILAEDVVRDLVAREPLGVFTLGNLEVLEEILELHLEYSDELDAKIGHDPSDP
jgi:hypothetical protein